MKTLIRPILVVIVALALAGGCLAEIQESSETPCLAFLEPKFVHEQSPVGERGKRAHEGVSMVNPDESLARISKRIGKELKWPVSVVDCRASQDAQSTITGYSNTKPGEVRFRQLKLIADKLKARYLVTTTIRELVGIQSGIGGFSPRRTGRANIDVMVYDRSEDNFVWQANALDTSSRSLFSDDAIAPRIDQALFNALRKALDPFLLKGERKTIPRPSTGLVATVKSVTQDGKSILLDLSSESGVKADDVFVSLDGSKRIRVTEVLQNGSIASSVNGVPAEEDIFKSEE